MSFKLFQSIFLLTLLTRFMIAEVIHQENEKNTAHSVADKAAVKKSWEANGFGSPDIQYPSTVELYPNNDDQNYTHRVNLTAIIFRNNIWTAKNVAPRLKVLADVYRQCGIKLGKVTLVECDAPEGKLDFAFYGPTETPIACQKIPVGADRPILFYIRYGSEYGSYAYSYPSSLYGETVLKQMSNTTVVSGSLFYLDKYYPKGFSAEAHELGHLLTNKSDNQGHDTSGVPNLMSGEMSLLNNTLTPEQCAAIKKSPLVRPL